MAVLDEASIRLSVDTAAFQQGWGEALKTLAKVAVATTAGVGAFKLVQRAIAEPVRATQLWNTALGASTAALGAAKVAAKEAAGAFTAGAKATEAATVGYGALRAGLGGLGGELKNVRGAWGGFWGSVGDSERVAAQAAKGTQAMGTAVAKTGAALGEGAGLAKLFKLAIGQLVLEGVSRLSAAIAQKLPEIEKGDSVIGFNYDTGERYLSTEGFLPVE